VKEHFAWAWRWMPRVLKRAGDTVSDIRRAVQVLSSLFDDAKACAFRVRRAWLTKTSFGQALDIIGEGRKMPRHPGETDESYCARLLHARELYQKGGTVPGMALAMELLGYPDATAQEPRYWERWRYDGTVRFGPGTQYGGTYRWATFTVTLPEIAAMTPEQLALILRTVRAWKPARSRLAHLVLQLEAPPADEFPATEDALTVAPTFSPRELYGDGGACLVYGAFSFGPGVRYGSSSDTLDVEVTVP